MLNPSHFRKLAAIALVILIPLAIVPPLAASSADRLAKIGAARLVMLSAGLALAFAPPEEAPILDREPDAMFTTARPIGEHPSVPRARRPHRIFVGPDLIRRATPSSARPKSTWVDRMGDRPSGMLIQSPGVLSGTILAGDVLFEAEGRPIASFESLISIVGQAYQRRSKYLAGRLYRHGETWAVTVEPGW